MRGARILSRISALALRIGPFLAGGALLWMTRSWARPRCFWELDDYIFGLTLHVFAPQASVPQPPFFPLFVGIARLARLVAANDVAALSLVSAVASCVSVVTVYVVSRELGHERRTAWTAAALMAFFPAAWFYAGIPESDGAGLALSLLTILLSLRSLRRPSLLPLAALAFGLAFAVRAQTTPIAFAPLLAAIGRAPRRRALLALLATAASLLVFWVVPIVSAAGGLAPALAVVSSHGRYLGETSALSAHPSLGFVARRWLVAPWISKSYACLALLAAGIGLWVSLRRQQTGGFLAVMGSAALYGAIAVATMDASFSGRYFLPLVPAIAVLAAVGGTAVEKKAMRGVPLVTLTLIGWSAASLLPALRVLHSDVAPAEVAAAAIHRSSGTRPLAIVYPRELHVQAPLLFPQATKIDAGQLERKMLDGPVTNVWRYGVRSINDSTAACWPALPPFMTIGTGRYLVVPYGPWKPGDPFFGRGWFQEETEGGNGCEARIFRWMGGESEATFGPASGDHQIDVEMKVPLSLLPKPPVLVMTLNGVRFAEFVPQSEELKRAFSVPASSVRSDRANLLEIHTSQTFVPRELGQSDSRRLGLRVFRLEMRP